MFSSQLNPDTAVSRRANLMALRVPSAVHCVPPEPQAVAVSAWQEDVPGCTSTVNECSRRRAPGHVPSGVARRHADTVDSTALLVSNPSLVGSQTCCTAPILLPNLTESLEGPLWIVELYLFRFCMHTRLECHCCCAFARVVCAAAADREASQGGPSGH